MSSQNFTVEFDFSVWSMREYLKFLKIQGDSEANPGDKLEGLMEMVATVAVGWDLNEKDPGDVEALKDLSVKEWASVLNQFGTQISAAFQS